MFFSRGQTQGCTQYAGQKTLARCCGPRVEQASRYRMTKSGNTGKNAARDFRNFVHREGKTFPVEISIHKVPVRQKVKTKHGVRYVKEIVTQYPLLLLSKWMKTILETCPKFMLGGHDISEFGYLDMFGKFWENFRSEAPDHPLFERPVDQRRATIPIGFHGDEGRGLGKSPVLILSYQVLIPHTGPTKLTTSQQLGHVNFRGKPFGVCICFGVYICRAQPPGYMALNAITTKAFLYLPFAFQLDAVGLVCQR